MCILINIFEMVVELEYYSVESCYEMCKGWRILLFCGMRIVIEVMKKKKVFFIYNFVIFYYV